MSKVKFELNRAGVLELMKSEEMQGVLSECAGRVLSRAQSMTGLEYKAEIKSGRTRASARVSADSAHAYYEALKNDTLLKALGGG